MRFANALKKLGVQKGTPVAIYMGMVPELPVAMLACTRLGAPHTVVFGGFSADSLSGRMDDMGCEVLITQDEAWRRGSTVPLKKTADEAMADAPGVRALGRPAPHRQRRPDAGRPRPLVARARGRCARRSGVVPVRADGQRGPALPHVHERDDREAEGDRRTRPAGYLCGVATTHHYIFDLKPETDVYWCAADIGWITGHSYIVYGPLCNGATSVLYEGTPDFPDKDRWWEIVERYGVTILYTAPTAIRAHMKWGPEHAQKHDLSSLRLLGSVGEPINPEAWIWYREHIGGDRTPIVDTWWQTETGMVMITPLPGVTTTKPGSATKPFPGVEAGVFDERGQRGRAGRRRLPRAEAPVAGDAARDLRRRRALPRDVLVEVRRTSTSPATARGSTRTATSGCSAASTT